MEFGHLNQYATQYFPVFLIDVMSDGQRIVFKHANYGYVMYYNLTFVLDKPQSSLPGKVHSIFNTSQPSAIR